MTVSNLDDESNLLDIDREPESGKYFPRWALILVLAASASFGLGMLAQQSLDSHQTTGGGGSALSVGSTSSAAGQIIADSSTHTYYLPWCSQAASISPANTVWFGTAQAAEAKGYIAGKDCPGL